jgi:hypothetical protein
VLDFGMKTDFVAKVSHLCRFSIALLDKFLDDGTNLAENVTLSRSACKLKYLVGCAPVCYGIPVKVVHGTGR